MSVFTNNLEEKGFNFLESVMFKLWCNKFDVYIVGTNLKHNWLKEISKAMMDTITSRTKMAHQPR